MWGISSMRGLGLTSARELTYTNWVGWNNALFESEAGFRGAGIHFRPHCSPPHMTAGKRTRVARVEVGF